MDAMYLDNLDEFINDEKRIVTYRWLSLTLNVSSNVAKQMLFHYYDVNHKKEKDQECKLSVTYLLSGLTFDENLKQDIHKICVVHDANLERAKQSFKQIYSLHIYSIQKVKLKDLHILYGIDYDKISKNVFQSAEYSSIVFPTAKIKSDPTASKQLSNVESIRRPSPQKQQSNIKHEEIEVIDQNKENKKNEKNTQLRSKKETKGSLASMFANQNKKQESKKPLEIKQEPNSKTKNVTDTAPKKGSLSSFLTKYKPVKKEEKILSVVEAEKPKKETLTKIKTPKKEILTKMEADSDTDVDEGPVKTVSKLEPKSSPKKNNENKNTPKNSQTAKRKTNAASKKKRKSSNNSNTNSKRQRIVPLDDSSSESSSEEEELMEECPVPASPPRTIESDDDEDIIPPTPKESDSSQSQTKANKRRKKKLVDKTFEDEKGFFVTKKEYEYVTDSDNDENPVPSSKTQKTSPKKSPAKPSAKTSPRKQSSPVKSKGRSPVKSKQSSITSFFKKN